MARFEVHAYWRRQAIKPDTVLYESFAGSGMLCNPEALFRELLNSPDMSHLKHIWAISKPALRQTEAAFADEPRVTIVRYGSTAYFRALATSQFLINNATFPPDFAKRPGQQYINTWHGTPLKKMGYDMPGGALEAANVIRNLVAADYLISANSVMTDMYLRAFRLRGIYRGAVIEEGYPRVDRQLLTADSIEIERGKLAQAGVGIEHRKIILYAPTWKGATFARPEDDLANLCRNVAQLTALIDSDEYVVLVKPHQAISSLGRGRPDLRHLLVPNEMPTNVLLGLTSILITDYSSIAYDFLATGRPVLYFTPDFDEYDESRGLYVHPKDWPGPMCRSIEELAAAVAASAFGTVLADEERYRSTRELVAPHEDGRSSHRIVDIVFRGIPGAANIQHGTSDGRIAMLMYLGGMRSNGITSAALNLLKSVDHDRFDVSVFYAAAGSADSRANQLAIDPRVRQFPRVGGMNGSKAEQLLRFIDYRRGLIRHHDRVGRRRLWDDEWTRCFGPATHFDHVIDFSGYGPFWAALLLHAPGAIRSIWLHNDLAADAHRVIRGRRRMRHSLRQIFTLYEQYDHLVSVSPELSHINRAALKAYAPSEKFTVAPNTIDAATVQIQARQPILGPAAEFLSHPETATFVSVGRLSPEKNHARLIRAFAQVHRDNPATQLLIVGDGPLAGALRKQVAQLKLERAVLLAGYTTNPHCLMAAADCFVLSSNYEGQPMVLLEAQILAMPIVSVKFASIGGALPPGRGLVVDQSDSALAAGMEQYLCERVHPAKFDSDRYQLDAIAAFVSAVGAVPQSEAGKLLERSSWVA